MDLDYFRLRAFLYPREIQQQAELKLSELESVWRCTQKNIKRKLKKYQAERLLEYNPGRGRGHQSSIRYKEPFEDEVNRYVLVSIEKQKYESILELFQLNIPKSWFTSVSEELNALFGLQSAGNEQEILRSIISRPISTLDPMYTAVAMESFLIQQFGDTLVSYDAITRKAKPRLAHNWSVNEEHTVWTFFLRKGVQFHHQRIMTSADVKYTFDRACLIKGPFYWQLEDLVSVECTSPHIVKFHLSKPNPFFIRYLCGGNMIILPHDVPFDEYKWIGSGAFKMKERTKEKIVLEAFDQYFLERPLLDRIEFWHVEDSTYRSFNIEVSGEEKVDYIERNDRRAGFTFLAFNFHRSKVVRHESFRRAIYHLFDVEKMYKDLKRDDLQVASSFFSWKSKQMKKDSSLIRGLLQEAAYEGEELNLFSLKHPYVLKEANWLAGEALKYGIRFKIKEIGFSGEYYSDKIEREADMMFNGEVPSPDSELAFVEAFQNKALIFRRFLSKEDLAYIDERLWEMQMQVEFEERDQIRDQIESYLRERQLLVFIKHPMKRQMFHSVIKGFVLDSYGYMDLRKMWIADKGK